MHTRRREWFAFVSLALVSCPFAFSIPAYGQAWLPPKNTGTVSIAYRHLYNHDHLYPTGKRYDAGQNRQHILLMDLDYGVTRRLALNLGIPLAFGKHVGADTHFDPTLQYIDDGKYHGGFRDFRLGLRYSLVRFGPVVITPFIEGIIPSHHYATFGNAATGRDLREFLVGTYLGRDLEEVLPNAYFQTRLSYAFVERVLGMYHDRTNIDAELGYQLTNRVAVSGIVSFQKTLGGLYSKGRWTLEQKRHHDQLVRSDTLHWGGGVSLVVNRTTSIYATLLTMAWGKNSAALSHGFTVGINKSFRTGRPRPALAADTSQP